MSQDPNGVIQVRLEPPVGHILGLRYTGVAASHGLL